MLKQTVIQIYSASVLRTGADGGHSYLKGMCFYKGKNELVTALMTDKAEEAKLTDGEFLVSYETSQFTQGAGLLLSGCTIKEVI